MRTTMLALLFILSILASNAQGFKKKTPEEKARKYTDELIAVIPLEKSVEEKIYLINIKVSKQFDSLYASKPEQDQLRKAYALIFKGRDGAYKEVMSKQQYLMYDDWQRELREKRQLEKAEKEKIESEKSMTTNHTGLKDSLKTKSSDD